MQDRAVTNKTNKLLWHAVLFQDAMQHICSIARTLSKPGSAAMLVGLSGRGKQTLARSAAFIAGVCCFQIQATRGSALHNGHECNGFP